MTKCGVLRRLGFAGNRPFSQFPVCNWSINMRSWSARFEAPLVVRSLWPEPDRTQSGSNKVALGWWNERRARAHASVTGDWGGCAGKP